MHAGMATPLPRRGRRAPEPGLLTRVRHDSNKAARLHTVAPFPTVVRPVPSDHRLRPQAPRLVQGTISPCAPLQSCRTDSITRCSTGPVPQGARRHAKATTGRLYSSRPLQHLPSACVRGRHVRGMTTVACPWQACTKRRTSCAGRIPRSLSITLRLILWAHTYAGHMHEPRTPSTTSAACTGTLSIDRCTRLRGTPQFHTVENARGNACMCYHGLGGSQEPRTAQVAHHTNGSPPPLHCCRRRS